MSSAIVSWQADKVTSGGGIQPYIDGVETSGGLSWVIAPGNETSDTGSLTNTVPFDGTPTPSQPLVAGNNSLKYTAAVGSGYPDFVLPVGDLTGDATYSITYN